MKTALAATAFYLILGMTAGQAAAADLTDADRSRLKTNNTEIQTVTYTNKGTFGFSVFTPGAAAATISTYSPLAQKQGTSWVKDLQIENTLHDVRILMADHVAKAAGISNFKHLEQTPSTSDSSPKKLKSLGGELLLDYTGNIKLVHYEGKVSDYHLLYSVRSRMIRLSDGKVLWNGYCNHDIEDNQPRDINMLRANNGAILKAWLKRGSNDCAARLANLFLGKEI